MHPNITENRGQTVLSRTRLLTALVAVFALATAACGDDGGSTAAPTTGDTLPAVESRFTGIDAYCTASEEVSAEAPEATEAGISEDEIVIAHVRQKLEDLEPLGFAVDNGDPADQVQTFVDVINEKCGGINGRQLVLETVEVSVPALSPDAELEAQEACTTIAEDQHAVAALSHSGVGTPIAGCLTGPNDVIFVTTYDLGESDFERSEGRLFSMNHSPTGILTYAARELAADLEGQRVGVVLGDEEPAPESAQIGLIDTLEDLGVEVVRQDILGCANGPDCADGLIASVQGMRDDEVDAIFPLLNNIALPAYLSEMVTQGFAPDDVDFYNTSFQAQDSELATGKIIEFAGEAAGKLYDGATIISGSRAGEHRLEGYEPNPFVAMCNATYVQNSTVVTTAYDFNDDDENRKASSVASACSMVRLLARAIEGAGVNPSRADVASALSRLGEVDNGEGMPSSFLPDKPTAPDGIVRETFHYPCELATTNDTGHCILPDTDFLPLPAE